MTPVRAWLPMDVATNQPMQFQSSSGPTFVLAENEPIYRRPEHAKVLIVEDTPENRKALGMEE